MLLSLRFSAPTLFLLGCLNAWTAYLQRSGGGLATALCLCVCAAGLCAEDLLQRDHRRDREVLVRVAAHPGATARYVANAAGAPERVIARSLARLTEDGLLVLVADDTTPALRTYRLAT